MKKSLKVKKNFVGNYSFTITVGGCGKTPEEAWASVEENIVLDGLGEMPEAKDITLDEEFPD